MDTPIRPPNTRRKGGGPKITKPPRMSDRAKALPVIARQDLLRIADFLSPLVDDAKHEHGWTIDNIHAEALRYCATMSPKTISRFASRTYMATTSGVDRPLLNAILYALGSTPLALEQFLAGIPALTAEETEMLALMRSMSPEDVQRQLTIARLDAQLASQRAQLERRPPGISIPRPETPDELAEKGHERTTPKLMEQHKDEKDS